LASYLWLGLKKRIELQDYFVKLSWVWTLG
jgi:hypothetical protein